MPSLWGTQSKVFCSVRSRIARRWRGKLFRASRNHSSPAASQQPTHRLVNLGAEGMGPDIGRKIEALADWVEQQLPEIMAARAAHKVQLTESG